MAQAMAKMSPQRYPVAISVPGAGHNAFPPLMVCAVAPGRRPTAAECMTMKIDGQCHCGYVTYEAEIDPERVSVCHCTDCQTLTGSPYRVSVSTSRESIVLTGNSPKTYVKIAENGRRRLQLFCPECGSPVFVTGEGADAEQW